MTGFQCLIAFAIILSLPGYNWHRTPMSARFLLLLAFVMALTVLLNWDFYEHPWKAFFRVRYFVIGALSIIPLDFYFNKYLTSESQETLLRKLLSLCLLAANAASVLGLICYFTGYNLLRMDYLEYERNSGTFGSVMAYAHSLAWLSLFMINVCLHRKTLQIKLPFWYLVFSSIVSLEALFTTHTRGAMLAWFLGCLIIKRKIAFAGLMFFILNSLGTTYLNKDFVSKHIVRPNSNEERIGSWLGAYEAFKMRPILGVGYLNYDSLSRKIKKEHNLPAPYFQGNAHSDCLELLACTGFVGFFCFIIWLGCWMVEIYKRGKLEQSFVFPFIIAFLISGITQVTLYTSETLIFLMATYALSLVVGPSKSKLTNLHQSIL